MDNAHNYEVNLKWSYERLGELSSPVLTDTVEVATPPEFPKGMEGIWSPEHLFVASVSSCLMTTFLAIAEFSKLDYESIDIKATGTLEKVDGTFMMSEILLEPEVVLPEGGNAEKAERILQKSEAACLITNSIKTSVHMKPTVRVNEPAELV